jgi:divalent metal cation (Fe/Co/Zn/Cd) transporter
MANSNKQFLGVLLGIFGIFLFWSAFTAFQQTPVLTNPTVIVGALLGAIFLYLAYTALQ